MAKNKIKTKGKCKLRIYVYPGSFDPVTNGHIDIIDRAAKQCDKLIVAVLVNSKKKPVFTIEERVELLKCALAGRPNIEIDSFTGLTVDYLKRKNASVIIRGLRAVSDFENEFQMAILNKQLSPDIETIFMMTSLNYLYLSSSVVRELAANNGNIDGLVPDCIKDRVIEKLRSLKK